MNREKRWRAVKGSERVNEEKEKLLSDEMKERNERRGMRGQRASGDDFSWRDGKRLSRLLHMEQRGKTSTSRQEHRGEEIREKGK